MVGQLNQRKDLIIAEMDSIKEMLISKIKQHPRICNSASLNVDMKTSDPDFSTFMSLDITLTQVSLNKNVKLLFKN